MPIYEYRRPDGTTFELQQSFSDDALTIDPETGVPVERVLHAPAVHFKGKGFYNTDYGKRKRGRSSSEGDSADERRLEELGLRQSSSVESDLRRAPPSPPRTPRTARTARAAPPAKDQKAVKTSSGS